MKKYIKAATKNQIANKIVDGFMKAGCTNISMSSQTDNCCSLEMNLPSGRHSSITVWYDYHTVNNGKYYPSILVPWKPSYTVQPNGDVYDGNVLVGQAIVRTTSTQLRQRIRKNYLISSIRTDSGDVIIDHPEIANNYPLIVQTLETRKIIQRS